MQQGSGPQIGVAAGDVCPAGNQQQHPPQSIQLGICVSGLHTHMEASPPDVPAALVEPPVAEPPVDASLFDVLPPVAVVPPVPPSDSAGELLLLQAASPTVEDAPLSTRT
jgi:hypothetical protein